MVIQEALQMTGIEQSKYCGHIYTGAATTAAFMGMEDSIIKTLGRWKDLIYL